MRVVLPLSIISKVEPSLSCLLADFLVSTSQTHPLLNGKRLEEKESIIAMETVRNQLRNLEVNLATLSSQFTEERAARGVLQTIVRSHLLNVNNAKEFEGIEWPTMESNI